VDRRRAALGRAALLAAPLIFLALFFLYPVGSILNLGLRPEGRLDLGGFVSVFGDPDLRSVIGFTIGQAFLSTVVTLALGLPAAFALSRYRFRGRTALRALAIVPFVLPTVVVGLAFGGGEGSLPALVAAHAFFNVAVVIRVVGTAWDAVDPALEDAAEELGAHGWRRATAVLIPLARPAIAGAATLVFLFSFTSFGAALLLAPPASPTLEVEIWRRTTQLLDLPVAAVLTIVQIAFVSLLLGLDAAIAARGAVDQPATLALPREPRTSGERAFVAVTIAGLLVFIAVPLARVVSRSLIGPAGITLDRYTHLGEGRTGGLFDIDPAAAIGTSLRTSSLATTIALLIALPVAAAVARAGSARGAWTLIGLPLGVSAVTLGFGYVVAFHDPPLDLRGSAWLVPIAQAVVALPFVLRIVTPALATIHRELAEQAGALGASPWRVVRDITLPVAASVIATAAVFAFAISLGEFGATAFLARAGRPTMPVAIVRLLGQPGAASLGQAYAMATLLMLVTAALALGLGGAAGRLTGGSRWSGGVLGHLE